MKEDIEEPEPTPIIGADRDSERKVIRSMALVCLGIIIAGAMFAVGTRASTRPRPIQLGNISAADIVEIRSERGEPVLFGEFRPHVDSLGTVEKDRSSAKSSSRFQPRPASIAGRNWKWTLSACHHASDSSSSSTTERSERS